MAGRLGTAVVLGLPGNPSSAFVTAFLLLLPLIRHLAGCVTPYPLEERGVLSADIPATQNRAEYPRGHIAAGILSVFQGQDSGLVKSLSRANALVIRPPFAPAMAASANAYNR